MTIHKDYLHDLGILLKEYAFDAKSQVKSSQDNFATGYMAGFHRVISLMQQQAQSFGIPLVDISLDGIDPDNDLT